jgi:hypothetical protein
MKTKFTLIAFLFIVSFSAHANQKLVAAGEKYFQNQNKISLVNGIHSNQFGFAKSLAGAISVPGYSEDYAWDPEANDWQHISNTTYTYDEVGRITEEIEQEAQTDIYLSRNSYSYDFFGNVTEDVSYMRGVEEWVPLNGERSDYMINQYGAQSGVIEQIIENGVWVNKTKTEYVLDSFNVPVGMMTYQWNGVDWTLYSKTVNLTWQNWQKRQLSGYTIQRYKDGQWFNGERYTSQYDGINYVGFLETWGNTNWENTRKEVYSKTASEETLTLGSWNGAGWVMGERYTKTFDWQGNQTKMEYSTWMDSKWIPEMVFYFDLKYNESIDVTEMVLRHSDLDNPEPINISKYVFSSFLYFGTTGTKDLNMLENVMVFPNPVTNSLNVRIDDTNTAEFNVSITNLAGQTFFTKNYSSPTITVNTEDFTKGMYLLNLKSSDGKIYSGKILKN